MSAARVLVLYYSRYGATAELARHICRGIESIDGAYDEVRSGQADAFVFDASIIQWLVANRPGVESAGPVIQPENYGIVTAQGSPLTETLNRSLLTLREDGTYERIKKSYFG